MKQDPYLQYGGSYAGDDKDSGDFKYVSWDTVPTFTPAHKSLMAETLTPVRPNTLDVVILFLRCVIFSLPNKTSLLIMTIITNS